MDQVHEFVSYAFREGIPVVSQTQTMEAIGAVTAGCPGLVSREAFYSERDRRWLAHSIWESEEAIEAAAGIADDPGVAVLFEQLESRSMRYGRFRRAVGTGATPAVKEAPVTPSSPLLLCQAIAGICDPGKSL